MNSVFPSATAAGPLANCCTSCRNHVTSSPQVHREYFEIEFLGLKPLVSNSLPLRWRHLREGAQPCQPGWVGPTAHRPMRCTQTTRQVTRNDESYAVFVSKAYNFPIRT